MCNAGTWVGAEAERWHYIDCNQNGWHHASQTLMFFQLWEGLSHLDLPLLLAPPSLSSSDGPSFCSFLSFSLPRPDTMTSCAATRTKSVSFKGPNGKTCVQVIKSCGCVTGCRRQRHKQVFVERITNSSSGETVFVNQTKVKTMPQRVFLEVGGVGGGGGWGGGILCLQCSLTKLMGIQWLPQIFILFSLPHKNTCVFVHLTAAPFFRAHSHSHSCPLSFSLYLCLSSCLFLSPQHTSQVYTHPTNKHTTHSIPGNPVLNLN